MKNLYCIVVTYNGMPWIEKCLNSLIQQSYPCKIICIDNGSADGCINFVRKNFPGVYVYELAANFGFGQANNIGLRIAINNNADYIFLLNQDAWVEKDTINGLISVQELNPTFKVISPVHLNGDGTAMDVYFRRYLNESEIDPKLIASNVIAKHSVLIKTAFVNAAAWLISSDALKTTGGFDPFFFHYGEDRNFLQRLSNRGFNAGIYMGEFIYHDRENRLANKPTSLAARIKTEWIHFLGRACDINYPGYLLFSVKRFCRHILNTLKYFFLLNSTESKFNFHMAAKIITAIQKIRNSREIALSQKNYPHLPSLAD